MMPRPLRDGRQVDRRGAGHDQRVQDRLVAVAVAEHEVAAAHHAVPDDLVRRGRAADDEERLVRAENPRGVALALGDRPGVVEQRAEAADRDGDVRAQRVLAEEGVEELPDRALAERDAAAVARRVPGIGAVQRVLHQRLEHRRRQAVEVVLRRPRDRPRHELGRILEKPHEGVGVAQDRGRHHLRGGVVAEQKDRQAVVLARAWRRALPRRICQRVASFSAPSTEISQQDFGVEDVNEPPGVLVADAADDAEALLLDRLGERPHAAAGGVLALEVLVDDRDRKALVELHMILPTEQFFCNARSVFFGLLSFPARTALHAQMHIDRSRNPASRKG